MAAQSLTVIGTVTALPSGLFPAGVTTSANIPVPDNASLFVRAYVDTSLHTNPVSTLKISVDLSLDGGQTWNVGWRWSARPGGPGALDINGVTLQNLYAGDQLPDGVGRLVRINITTNMPLQTGAFVDFLVPAVV